MTKPLSLIAVAVLAGLTHGSALAEGIELPKVVRPSIGGDFIVRPIFSTNNAVQGLSYNIFTVNNNGSLGDALEDVTLRPSTINTAPGEKKRVFLSFPQQAVTSERLLAVCMWKDPTIPQSGGQSQLLAAFRYCKLFKAKP